MSEFHYVRIGGDTGGVEVVPGPAIGMDLEAILKDGLPPIKAALEIVAALCEILDIAEQDGEVHGDIAPDWVFIDDTGAVSVEGFGIKRQETMAPEGRPRGVKTDLYGLGYTAYRLIGSASLDDIPIDDADTHDDAVIDAIVSTNFDGMPEEIVGDVQWFLAKMMSFDHRERPAALEAWRSFIAFSDAVPGGGIQAWAAPATQGGGERRHPGKAPKVVEEDELGGPVMAAGPLSRGGLSFGGGNAKPGQATAFWSREQMKAALDADEEEEEYRPAVGGGTATSFWSKDQMNAMARGDAEAPRPKRGLGTAQARGTMMMQRSEQDRAEIEKRRHDKKDVPPPPGPALSEPPLLGNKPKAPVTPPPVASGPVHPPPVIGGPSAKPPVIGGPSAKPPVIGGPSAKPPVIGGPVGKSPPVQAEPERKGGAMKWVVIGVVALSVLTCGGIALVGGGYGAFRSMGAGDTTDVTPPSTPKVEHSAPKPVKDTGEEKAPAEVPAPPDAAKSPATKPAETVMPITPPATTKPITQPSSTRPSSTKPAETVRSAGGSTRPGSTRPTAPAPAAGGPIEVTFRAPGPASLRCTDGQQPQFDGSTTLKFDGPSLPVTCMVTMEGKRGAAQVDKSGTVSCSVAGAEVVCR